MILIKKILLSIAATVGVCSYWICLLTAMIAAIFYISGIKKAGRYISLSIVVYILTEIFKNVAGECLK